MDAATSILVASLATAVAMPNVAPPPSLNWCQVGYTVMIPDGREGPVTSTDGDICRVLVYGEGYVSLWAFYLVEPVYPQDLPYRAFGH
jgi:hypothetical protein